MQISHRARRGLAAVVACLATLGVLSTGPAVGALPPGAGLASTAAAYPLLPVSAIRHVVAISIDGLRADAITRLGPERVPHLFRLLREGASTLNARNLVELTITLPNHSSMVTGLPVTDGGHGVTFNNDSGATIHSTAGRYVPSVFDVVHDHGGSTGLYVGKVKFGFLDRSWDGVHGARDEFGYDDGRDKITTYLVGRASAAVARQLVSDDPYAFSFLHLRHPDSAGHAHGWMSKRYLAAVVEADDMVGEVLAAIDSSPDRTGDTAIILTADHGGLGERHDQRMRLANYRIPFIVWGPGVAAGADLYELNPASHSDPGAGRPGYAGPQPIRNGEVANLATDLLGLPPVPGSVFDAAQDLEVFAEG